MIGKVFRLGNKFKTNEGGTERLKILNWMSGFTPPTPRTALILGCEYGCKDAVEVLLKSGSDVKAVDNLGHDAYHYARHGKNSEVVAMVKSYLEKAIRGLCCCCCCLSSKK